MMTNTQRFWFAMVSVVLLFIFSFAVIFMTIPDDNQGMANFISGILVGSLFGKIYNAALGINIGDPKNGDTTISPTKTTTSSTTTVTPIATPNIPIVPGLDTSLNT